MNRYFGALWRAKLIILSVTAVVAAATWFYARRQPTAYSASGLLQVGRVWKDQIEDPYVVTETINSPGFAHDVASAIGLKPGQLKRSVHATTVTAGPPRATYPILVQVTATTDNAAESARIAEAILEEVIKRHDSIFDQAMAPHLSYQQIVESRLADSGFPPQALSSTSAPNQTLTSPTSGRMPGDEVVKWQRELQDVRTSNTSPTYTERSHLVDKVVPTGSVSPDKLKPAATAASITLLVAVVCVLLLESLSAGVPLAAKPRSAEAPGGEVQS
ncbi:MAG TPA: hypothetical protein VEZ90_14315 [Blastocatellia bacterium]|nr:hypothetical protein [Blastocatellia bacterium]